MFITKERIQETVITAAITFIVSIMGTGLFNGDAGIYSGITSGLSFAVGKEYGDSLNKEKQWEWRDILFGVIGIIVGILMFYLIKAS